MTSTELKDALSRRLKKIDGCEAVSNQESVGEVSPAPSNEARTSHSPDAKDMNQLYRSGWNAPAPIPRSTALPALPLFPSSPMKSDATPRKPSPEEINSGVVDQRVKDLADRRQSRGSVVSDVLLEGYLYKFSSGTLTSRWQKRYFVLTINGLEYFGKQAHARASVPGASVSFPMRRIKAVIEGSSSREFELNIGTSKRKYFIKASSTETCISWITELRKSIAAFPATTGSGDSMASEDEIESDLIGGSSLNDNSSSREGCEITVADTLWEQPEISSEEIDALFSEWFMFLEDPHSEIKAGRMIDAASRAVSDLWSVIAHLPRGEDVSFSEAKDKLMSQIAASNGHERASITTGEYVVRVCEKFQQWVYRRTTSDDIPVLIEWTLRFKRNLNTLGLGVELIDTDSNWARGMNEIIRKLASEWEVGLIEDLHRSMPSESLWDLPPARCVSSSLGAPTEPLLITSWTEKYLSQLTAVCLSQSTTKGTPWQAAYPTCSLLLTTHAASAIVASLNACWREFKRRSAAYAKHKASTVESMMNKVRFIAKRSHTAPDHNVSVSLDSMIAFGNEATLISIFCQHASALSEFRAASPAFAACLESLSGAFANTSNEVARCIVKLQFLKRNKKTILSAFDPKILAVRVQIPISETLSLAKEFIESLPATGCHELLAYLIIGQVMQGVANAYITSLIRHKPKTSKFTRLAAVVAEDEALFFSMFKDLGRQATEINTAIDQISQVHTVLSQQNRGLSLVQECVELTKAFPASQKAIEVVKALLDMRGISKADRKDIIYSVTACMKRHAESPSPAFLDISREDEDEDARPHDGSGFSSNRSSSKAADESPSSR